MSENVNARDIVLPPETEAVNSEYVKQVWEDGVSPVNAERLNHMEEGIANAGGLVMTCEFDFSTGLPKFEPGSCAKLQAALNAFQPVTLYIAMRDEEGQPVAIMNIATLSLDARSGISFDFGSISCLLDFDDNVTASE